MARIDNRWLMADSMRAHLDMSFDTGQGRKNLRGVGRNSRERPDLKVSLTQASDVISSHRSAKMVRRPPMAGSDEQLLAAVERTASSPLKGLLGLKGSTSHRSILRALLS